ncbi:MAG TPA: Uma2 family endonuclease [Actinomycetota bacterium]|nr:Uma2 family endonuclease [Actinomycetota bacterium]
MAAVRDPDRLTYEDYSAFPDDGVRRELIDGEVYVTPAPRTRHQTLVLRIAVALQVHVAPSVGGAVFVAPYDVVLSDFDVVQPDVLFIADADRQRLTPENLRGAPTLAVEVLSDARRDRRLKRHLYARAGVPEYWIVDPDSDWVEVYRLADGSYATPEVLEAGSILRTPLLPGLEIDVKELVRQEI